MNGIDPVSQLAIGAGLTEIQASEVALATDFVTAVVSVNAVFKGTLALSGNKFTSGTLGVISSDGASTINTLEQLYSSPSEDD